MMKTSIRLALLLGSLLTLALMLTPILAQSTGPGAPPSSGTVAGIAALTLYSAPLTGSTTVYSTRDVNPHNYHSFDLFVSVDISGTGAITVTPQFSADGVNWANATYSYVGTPLSYATTVTASTTTATVTNTVTATGTPTVYKATYQILLAADGADYVTLPMAGYDLRVKLTYSGTLTPTIRAVGRND